MPLAEIHVHPLLSPAEVEHSDDFVPVLRPAEREHLGGLVVADFFGLTACCAVPPSIRRQAGLAMTFPAAFFFWSGENYL